MFEIFWKLYPRKIARKTAETSWRNLPNYRQVEALQAIKKHLVMWKQQGTENKYIPHASTWLNQMRFEDEIELAPEMPQCDWNRNGMRDVAASRCADQAVKEVDGQHYCAAHCARLGMRSVK